MKHQKFHPSPVAKLFIFTSCLTLTLGVSAFKSGFTQSQEERKVNVHTYNRMPVIVKEIRNLNRKETWFRDLEIEVKNVSRQPIYFISLGLEFPNIPAFTAPQPLPDGNMPTKGTTGFSVDYGAPRLSDLRVLAGPDDVPIKPGGSHVFKIPEAKVIGIEWMNQNMNLPPDAWKQIELSFDLISFGDGTGFMGSRRELYSKKKAGEQ
jgi:hypothetical protein